MAIRILSPEVAAKIAAGEVIERPASVGKELVENSLDAQATSITVEINGGGTALIRIQDNGTGIAPDEVELVFQRYATSKVNSSQDLDAISTLGFRGEALGSIATVSHVSLLTRTPNEDAGTLVEAHEGETIAKTRQGSPQGTTVTVRHLFRNVPARLKFLRSIASETGRVQALVTRYAQAYPEVRFTLLIDGSTAFASHGAGNMREVLAAVYDLDTAQAMLELGPGAEESGVLDPKVWGLIGPPSLTRANRSYMTFFVNRRWVQNRLLGYALEQAYHGFLMERRYPIAVVNITMPYQDVDVNVHPAKSEVRFQKENQVFSALQRTVRQTLTSVSPIHQIQTQRPSIAAPGTVWRGQEPAFWPGGLTQTSEAASLTSLPPTLPLRSALPVLRVLGQVQNTYIVAEGPNGVYLIDQHAAHERILFERVREAMRRSLSETQSIVEPVPIELDAEQDELVCSQRDLLKRSGFQVEPFGPRTYLLRGVPSLMTQADHKEAFLRVLDMLNEGGGFKDWHERLAYSIACHTAIRAGASLTQQEMVEMVLQLEECQQPQTCPHGRPTMIHLSSGHLEREFGRR